MDKERIYDVSMDRYSDIANGFQDVIELISISVDTLAGPLQQAADLCTGALLNEGKLLCCGNGSGAVVSQLLVTALIHRFEQDRPALPAICLSGDGASMSAIATAQGSHEIYARQVRALGQADDILLGVAAGEGNSSLIQAVSAAHDRDMAVVVLTGGGSDITSLLRPEDIEIHVRSASAPRIIELQIMIAHCLCKLIDQALFGNYDP